MTNMQTYYVVFVGHKHGVYDYWVECQKNVLLYKGSVYKAYTLKRKLSELGCSMNQDGWEVMNVHQLENQSLDM